MADPRTPPPSHLRLLSAAWCAAQGALYAVILALWWAGVVAAPHPPLLWLSVLLPAGICLAGLGLAVLPRPRPLVPPGAVLVVGGLAAAGWLCWMLPVLANAAAEAALAGPLAEVQRSAVGESPAAVAQLQAYVERQCGRHVFLALLFLGHIQLDVLRYAGHPVAATALHFGFTTAFLVTAFISPGITPGGPEVAAAVALALYAAGVGLCLTPPASFRRLCRNRVRALDVAVDLATDPRAPGPPPDWDGMWCHVLTNTMADAVGCIDLCLEGAAPVGEQLRLALDCLARGLRWCKKRQALAQIVAGTYLPQLGITYLRTQARALAGTRPLQLQASEAPVLADAVLLELLLEPALHHAFRHGGRPDPNVSLTLKVIEAIDSPLPPDDLPGDLRLLCEVGFDRGADPSPPTSAAPASPLGAGLGLPQAAAVAAAQGLAFDLRYQSQRVVVCVVVPVQRVPLAAFGSVTTAESPGALAGPTPGLRYACIDDSSIARRILVHTIKTHCSPLSVVDYGDDPSDAERFVQEAATNADVVIVDQHLDYPTVLLRGTDLIQQLLGRGYRGLVVVRSANASAVEAAAYRRGGAHCVLGKDVRGAEVADRLAAAYHRLMGRPGNPSLMGKAGSRGTLSGSLLELPPRSPLRSWSRLVAGPHCIPDLPLPPQTPKRWPAPVNGATPLGWGSPSDRASCRFASCESIDLPSGPPRPVPPAGLLMGLSPPSSDSVGTYPTTAVTRLGHPFARASPGPALGWDPPGIPGQLAPSPPPARPDFTPILP